MSFFSQQQEDALQKLFHHINHNGTDLKAIALIQDFELINGLNKDNLVEIIKQDVLLNADNAGIDVSEKELSVIAYKVINKYDTSDYHDFIDTMIHNITDN